MSGGLPPTKTRKENEMILMKKTLHGALILMLSFGFSPILSNATIIKAAPIVTLGGGEIDPSDPDPGEVDPPDEIKPIEPDLPPVNPGPEKPDVPNIEDPNVEQPSNDPPSNEEEEGSGNSTYYDYEEDDNMRNTGSQIPILSLLGISGVGTMLLISLEKRTKSITNHFKRK